MTTSSQERPPKRFSLRDVALSLGLPALLYGVVTLGFGSPYSQHLYSRQHFLAQYDHGVYRYRFVGRELVLATAHILTLLHIHVATLAVGDARQSSPWGLFSAITISNGMYFIVFAAILYVATARRANWTGAYISLVAFAAVCSYVVTPYDDLRDLVMVVTLLIATRARAWSWPLCLVLSIVGVATHEAFFVLAAALVALVVTRSFERRTLSGYVASWSRDTLAPATAAVVVGSIVTYGILRVVIAGSARSRVIESLRGVTHLNFSGAFGITIALLGLLVVLSTVPRESADTACRHWYRRATVALWVLSLPYIVVALVGGNLFEAPRLVLPLALAQYLIAWVTLTDSGKNIVTPARPS